VYTCTLTINAHGTLYTRSGPETSVDFCCRRLLRISDENIQFNLNSLFHNWLNMHAYLGYACMKAFIELKNNFYQTFDVDLTSKCSADSELNLKYNCFGINIDTVHKHSKRIRTKFYSLFCISLFCKTYD